MLAKRIIPCLDVRGGRVVKGVQFLEHRDMGGIEELAELYSKEGADELVFYDITASSERRTVSTEWVSKVANLVSIPFCVAGGIRTSDDAARILDAGADKISINTPALEDPDLVDRLAARFGNQCVVVGIDSKLDSDGAYRTWKNTGAGLGMQCGGKETLTWAKEVYERGAGEIVLNCMSQDGTRDGFDIAQVEQVTEQVKIPVVASGGAGGANHFKELFTGTAASAGLAATIFHEGQVRIKDLKESLQKNGVPMRTPFRVYGSAYAW